MQLLDIAGAKTFCSDFSGSIGRAEGDMRDFLSGLKLRGFQEGQQSFNEYRDCVLREAHRRLYLATANFRRAHDLMVSSSAPWAHVTLYYASFLSSSALMAMFGGWVDYPHTVVYAQQVVAGQQQFAILRDDAVKRKVSNKGGHRGYWDLFYQLTSSLAAWIPIHLTPAIQPVNHQVSWQVDARNSVNYQSRIATAAAEAFESSFKAASFPACLTGDLGTQFKLAGETIELAHWAARTVGLATDALDRLPPNGLNRTKFRAALHAASPRLATQGLRPRFGL